jgi:hypothetical protein
MPATAPIRSSLGSVEAQEAVRIALRIVEEADTRHYELLAKARELTAVFTYLLV